MFRTRVLLVLALALATVSATAQYPPVSGEDPAPYVDAIMKACTIDQKALACSKADNLKERALLNLSMANFALDAMDGAAAEANDVQKAIDVGKNVKDALCGGDGLAALEGFVTATNMLVSKIGEGYFQGQAARYLQAADECLEKSQQWAELCEECCRQLDMPNFIATTIIDKNPETDFSRVVQTKDLRHMLEQLTPEERKATREQAEKGTLNACEENKRVILDQVKADGSLR